MNMEHIKIDVKRQAEILEKFEKDDFQLCLSPRELYWLFTRPENIAYSQLFQEKGLICHNSQGTRERVIASYDDNRGFMSFILYNDEGKGSVFKRDDVWEIQLDWIASHDEMQAPVRMLHPRSQLFGQFAHLTIWEQGLGDF